MLGKIYDVKILRKTKLSAEQIYELYYKVPLEVHKSIFL